jgi:WXG100 family type VII secretion target
MASIQLKVDVDALVEKSSEISDVVGKIKTSYESLKSIAEASSGYWEGDAANAFRKYVKSIDKDMQSVLKRLGEHPTDLLKMADVYEKTESAIIEQADTLPENVIS